MIDFQNKLLSLLNDNNFTVDQIKNVELSLTENIEAYYKSFDYARIFIQDIIIPFVEHQINPSEKDRVVNHIFLKIHCLIHSILNLNHLYDFLTIASITRSIFELYLDLILLSEEIINGSLIKFSEFIIIQKFKIAKRTVDFYESKNILDEDYSSQKVFVNSYTENIIKDKVLKNWGKNSNPKSLRHWSGLDTRKITRQIDQYYQRNDHYYEKMYIQIFLYCSLYVHSDPTGSFKLDETFLQYVIGKSNSHIHEIIINTLKVFGKYSCIDKAFPNYYETIENIRNSVGYFITEKQILKLKAQLEMK
jgi:hypothetical protein